MSIDPTTAYRLPKPDSSVSKQDGEGRSHWKMKASLVAWLRHHEDVKGEVKWEKKVGELIPDVTCTLQTDDGDLVKCAFEIQTCYTKPGVVRRIRRLHRHDCTVFYVFPASARNPRRRLTRRLAKRMEYRPRLGHVSAAGVVRFGTPLAPGMLDDVQSHESQPFQALPPKGAKLQL